MVDEADIANDLMDSEVSRALGKLRQRAAHAATGVVVKECVECGEDIPPARRALGFKLCVPCAEEAERRGSMFAD